MAGSIHHSDLAQLVLKESGYFDMLQNNKSPDAETRIENLAEFLEAMSDFESLQDFLEHIALVTDRESRLNMVKCLS